MEEIQSEKNEQIPEKGANIHMLIVGMRHGEKSGNELTDLGRDITAERAQARSFDMGAIDMIKGYGSDAGKSENDTHLPRAFETADIYATTAGERNPEKIGTTRKRSVLSFEQFKNPQPFDWHSYYDKLLPEGFSKLPDDEKKEAAKVANAATLQHMFDLANPKKNSDTKLLENAQRHIEENAAAVAYQLRHFVHMTQKLDSGSKVLLPTAMHGVMPESFMKEALVRESEDGNKINGFENIDEFGGDFNPSESFDVDIQTNKKGKLQQLNVSFAQSDKRPNAPIMYLDLERIEKLAELYAELHREELKERGSIIK